MIQTFKTWMRRSAAAIWGKLKKQKRVAVLRKEVGWIDWLPRETSGRRISCEQSKKRKEREKRWVDSLNSFKCPLFGIPLMMQLGLQNRTIWKQGSWAYHVLCCYHLILVTQRESTIIPFPLTQLHGVIRLFPNLIGYCTIEAIKDV